MENMVPGGGQLSIMRERDYADSSRTHARYPSRALCRQNLGSSPLPSGHLPTVFGSADVHMGASGRCAAQSRSRSPLLLRHAP